MIRRMLCRLRGGHFMQPWRRGIHIEYRFCDRCPYEERRPM